MPVERLIAVPVVYNNIVPVAVLIVSYIHNSAIPNAICYLAVKVLSVRASNIYALMETASLPVCRVRLLAVSVPANNF